MLTKQLAGAPYRKHHDAGTDNDADSEPKPRGLVPSRREFICSFEKRLIGAECDVQLLAHHLSGVLEQLDFLLPQPDSTSEREHLVLLIQEEPLNTGKVRFAARLCGCGGYGYGCSFKA